MPAGELLEQLARIRDPDVLQWLLSREDRSDHSSTVNFRNFALDGGTLGGQALVFGMRAGDLREDALYGRLWKWMSRVLE